MPVFMIERRWAEQFESSADEVDGINRINDEEGVRWLYSFLSADRRKTYCLYEARRRTRSGGRRYAPGCRPTSWSRWSSASCPTAPASRSDRDRHCRCENRARAASAPLAVIMPHASSCSAA